MIQTDDIYLDGLKFSVWITWRIIKEDENGICINLLDISLLVNTSHHIITSRSGWITIHGVVVRPKRKKKICQEFYFFPRPTRASQKKAYVPFHLCDQHVFNVTIVWGRICWSQIGGAKLPERFLRNVGVENVEILNVKHHVRHGALAQVLRTEGGDHLNFWLFWNPVKIKSSQFINGPEKIIWVGKKCAAWSYGRHRVWHMRSSRLRVRSLRISGGRVRSGDFGARDFEPLASTRIPWCSPPSTAAACDWRSRWGSDKTTPRRWSSDPAKSLCKRETRRAGDCCIRRGCETNCCPCGKKA